MYSLRDLFFITSISARMSSTDWSRAPYKYQSMKLASMSCLVMLCRASPIEFEQIHKLAKGFAQEVTTSLVLSDGSFQSIINHTRIIGGIRHAEITPPRDSIAMVSSVCW